MKNASSTEELEDAFDTHLKQTERHIKRLEKVFQLIGKNPEGKKCEAMDGLLKEGKNIISETEDGTLTRDAALIIAAQKIEHYEIASYGGLAQLAITMRDMMEGRVKLGITDNQRYQTIRWTKLKEFLTHSKQFQQIKS